MSLKEVDVINNASNFVNASTQVSVSHNLVEGYKRVVVIGWTARKGNGGIGIATVTYGGAACTLARYAEWTDGEDEHRNAGIYYILEDDLPANGTQTARVSVVGTSEMGIFVIQLRNVHQGAPYATGAASAAHGVVLKVQAAVSRAADVVFAVSAAPDGTAGYGAGQVVFGNYLNTIRHRASYDPVPTPAYDLQILDSQGEGVMVTTTFTKVRTPVGSRVFIIE